MQHILIVDDNPARAAALAHVLADRGGGATLAGTRAQALAVLGRGYAGAVILPQAEVGVLAPLAGRVPLVCLARCDETTAPAVFALSPLIYAVMDPDTPAPVIADLVLSAMRDTPAVKVDAPVAALPAPVAPAPVVPAPVSAPVAAPARARLTLA